MVRVQLVEIKTQSHRVRSRADLIPDHCYCPRIHHFQSTIMELKPVKMFRILQRQGSKQMVAMTFLRFNLTHWPHVLGPYTIWGHQTFLFHKHFITLSFLIVFLSLFFYIYTPLIWHSFYNIPFVAISPVNVQKNIHLCLEIYTLSSGI